MFGNRRNTKVNVPQLEKDNEQYHLKADPSNPIVVIVGVVVVVVVEVVVVVVVLQQYYDLKAVPSNPIP